MSARSHRQIRVGEDKVRIGAAQLEHAAFEVAPCLGGHHAPGVTASREGYGAYCWMRDDLSNLSHGGQDRVGGRRGMLVEGRVDTTCDVSIARFRKTPGGKPASSKICCIASAQPKTCVGRAEYRGRAPGVVIGTEGSGVR